MYQHDEQMYRKGSLHIIIVVLLLVCSSAWISCRKADTPARGPYSSLAQAFLTVAPQSEMRTVNNSTATSIYCKKGTRVRFQPFSIIKPDKDTVEGTVDLEVLECLSKADMIFSRVLPHNRGIPLITAGELFIRLSRGTQRFIVKDSMRFLLNIPSIYSGKDTNLSVYSGFPYNLDSASLNLITWSVTTKSPLESTVRALSDTTYIQTDSVGYISACMDLAAADYRKVSINIAGMGRNNVRDLCVYASYDNVNSVHIMASSNSTYIENVYIASRPAHIIVMAVVDGFFYGGISPAIVPAEGAKYDVTMIKTTPVAFRLLIDALP